MTTKPSNVPSLEVRTDHISPNPFQSRKTFNEESLRELAESIREHGIIQPLIVCPNGAPGTYLLIAGERRWRAAQSVGLETVPVVVKPHPGDDALEELAIVENIQREDLNAVDEALSYQRLLDRLGNVKAVAQKLKKHPTHIYNRLTWLKLEPEIQNLVVQGALQGDVRVANALLSIDDSQKRVALAQRLAGLNATIKAIELACRRLSEKIADANEPMLTRARRSAGKAKPDAAFIPLAALREAARNMCAQCDVKSETLANRVGEPAWTLIVHSANETCGQCSVRDVAGACDGCPGVEMLRRIIEVQKIKQELSKKVKRA